MLAAMRQNDTGLRAERVLVPAEIALTAEELEHTRRVGERIAAEIRGAGGWISFERYMDIALYAPGLGYYSAGARKLGPGGDFVTAPEISRLFGGCVAQQCARGAVAARRGIDPGDRRGNRRARGGCAVAPRCARPAARPLSHSRGERGSARTAAGPAQDARTASARARRVVGCPARRSPSTASCSPMKCSTRCRWRAFAGGPSAARSWASPSSTIG